MLNYYEILDLGSDGGHPSHSHQELKDAYRKALLRYHPDKDVTSYSRSDLNRTEETITVDQVTLAYKTLSDPVLKAEYDRSRTLTHDKDPRLSDILAHHAGLETVDLDSLAYDEQSQTWSRSCRCGDGKGYTVTEPELEKHVEHGELMVGCKGCSLWLRVLFGIETGD